MATRKRAEEQQLAVQNTETQALAVRNADLFPVLNFDQQELSDLIQDNLGGMLPKLQRIIWPTGGNLTFNLQTDEGEKPTGTLRGVIVHHIPNRLFWEKSFDESGGGEQPDCQSPDGMNGYGNPFDNKT